jgi:hypothetical protein
MQQAELHIKAAEQQRKVAKDLVDAKLKAKQIDIDAMKTAAQIKQQKANRDIDALKTVAQLRHDKDEAMRTHAMTAIAKAAELSQRDAQSKIGHVMNMHNASNKPKQETKKKGD